MARARGQVNISREGSKAGIARGGCRGIDCSEFLHALTLRAISLRSGVNVVKTRVAVTPRVLANLNPVIPASYGSDSAFLFILRIASIYRFPPRVPTFSSRESNVPIAKLGLGSGIKRKSNKNIGEKIYLVPGNEGTVGIL